MSKRATASPISATQTIGGRLPALSICIPTYNRAALLDLCLERLTLLSDSGIDFEVIVSDNGSSDETQAVAQRWSGTFKRFRFTRFRENRGGIANWHNVFRHAQGTLVTYLADDDRLIPSALATHVSRMLADTTIVATYADWIAYDDEADREMHRYFPFLTQRREFNRASPLELLDFVLSHQVLPEIGIWRRTNFLQAMVFVKGGYTYYNYLYLMARQGSIAFDPMPFYVENRRVRKQLSRGSLEGDSRGLYLVNDDIRSSLQLMILRAYQDCGMLTVPADRVIEMLARLESRMLMRVPLEATQAAAKHNWILASELTRRSALWLGERANLDMQSQIDSVVVPAALQAIRETFEFVDGVTKCAFSGFRTNAILDEFRSRYPEVPIESSVDLVRRALANGDTTMLHVVKTSDDLAQAPFTGTVIIFESLIAQYMTVRFDISLGDL